MKWTRILANVASAVFFIWLFAWALDLSLPEVILFASVFILIEYYNQFVIAEQERRALQQAPARRPSSEERPTP